MNRRAAILNGSAMVVSASLGAIACGAPSAVAQSAASAASGSAGDGSLVEVHAVCRSECADSCTRTIAACRKLVG